MLYDTLGAGYATRRIADPRIAALLLGALRTSRSVVNVGAGTGSYEPTDRQVVAVEPSEAMIRQRSARAAPVVQALAAQLPLRDECTSAAMAVLTVHHWSNRAQSYAELGRIARDRIVVLTWDPDGPGFWLTEEYFPRIAAMDRKRFPRVSEIARALGRVTLRTVPIPSDCTDGFLGAFWRRPHAYLDPQVRRGMSGFAQTPGLEQGLERLRSDLDSGAWQRRFGRLLQQPVMDLGYRLIIAEHSSPDWTL